MSRVRTAKVARNEWQYAYNELAGGANNSRIVSMTYPNARVLNFNYNTGVDTT
jgi:hypothetical protein